MFLLVTLVRGHAWGAWMSVPDGLPGEVEFLLYGTETRKILMIIVENAMIDVYNNELKLIMQ